MVFYLPPHTYPLAKNWGSSAIALNTPQLCNNGSLKPGLGMTMFKNSGGDRSLALVGI